MNAFICSIKRVHSPTPCTYVGNPSYRPPLLPSLTNSIGNQPNNFFGSFGHSVPAGQEGPSMPAGGLLGGISGLGNGSSTGVGGFLGGQLGDAIRARLASHGGGFPALASTSLGQNMASGNGFGLAGMGLGSLLGSPSLSHLGPAVRVTDPGTQAPQPGLDMFTKKFFSFLGGGM